MAERISNKIFRERFQQLAEDEGLSLAEIASRVGWEATDRRTKQRKPDSSRVARTLGLVAEGGTKREYISYENAVLLCRALHVDYWEVGV